MARVHGAYLGVGVPSIEKGFDLGYPGSPLVWIFNYISLHIGISEVDVFKVIMSKAFFFHHSLRVKSKGGSQGMSLLVMKGADKYVKVNYEVSVYTYILYRCVLSKGTFEGLS
jgi:hypothetical protein